MGQGEGDMIRNLYYSITGKMEEIKIGTNKGFDTVKGRIYFSCVTSQESKELFLQLASLLIPKLTSCYHLFALDSFKKYYEIVHKTYDIEAFNS